MRFGIGIPNCREGIFYPIPFAGTQEIVKLTQLAERLGYDSVWATDFMNPVPTMGFPETQQPSWYEVLITLAYLAGVTQRIKLAAGVVLLPYRDPVILAKQAATLDQYSGGRFLFGWGLGQSREEFESIQSKNRKAHRGRMLEEQMEALHLLLNSEGKVSFVGEYYEFHDVELNPKPLQQPLPVYIVGHSKDTPARIARWATGVSISITSVSAAGGSIHEAMESLRLDLRREGQDPAELDMEISTQLRLGRTHEEAVRAFKSSWLGRRFSRRNPDAIIANSLVGTSEEVAEKVAGLEDAGITLCMATNVAADTFDEMVEQVQMFSEEVMSKFR